MKRTREQALHHDVKADNRLRVSRFPAMPVQRNTASPSHTTATVTTTTPSKDDVDGGVIQCKNSEVLDERERREVERRLRMERLRAEIEAEEKVALARTHKQPEEKFREITHEDLRGLDEDEQMKLFMGFGDFNTTKGKAVKDNHTTSARGAVAKNKARKYRQYMNRKGGFNRPLDKLP
jgi:U4/U6.U5 tri-snRNP-associated protein 3